MSAFSKFDDLLAMSLLISSRNMLLIMYTDSEAGANHNEFKSGMGLASYLSPNCNKCKGHTLCPVLHVYGGGGGGGDLHLQLTV